MEGKQVTFRALTNFVMSSPDPLLLAFLWGLVLG